MPTTYKVLGQVTPSANTDTTLYTVPNATQAVISTLTIANTNSAAATFRIAIRPAGAALATQHYVAYDVTVGSYDTTALTLGLTLAATDVVTVRASATGIVFHAYGSEIS